MKTPNMPTMEQFLEATTVRLGGKLGFSKLGPVLSRERLGTIDAELYNWWNIPINSYDKKIGATLRLMRWCADWAQKHQGDGGATRTGAQRMIAVQNLVTQCKLWLGKLYTDSGKLRSLGADYKAERDAYKTAKGAGQKVNPVGGSYLHKLKEEGLPDELANGPVGQVFAKSMDQMTATDFKTLAEAVLSPGERHMATTLYMDSNDRGEHILTIKNGEFCDLAGSPITKTMVYAMSKYGTIYGFDWKTAYLYDGGDHSTGYFNHSSFMSGKDVICAGTIDKIMGQDAIAFPQHSGKWAVTTDSGHYKPTADHLKNCLKALKASGLNLNNYVAKTSFPPPTLITPAATFIQ